MTLLLKSKGRQIVHAWLDLDLLVRSRVRDRLPVQPDHLLLVADGLYASAVELFESGLQRDADGWHWRQLRLVEAGEGRAEETALVLHGVAVAQFHQVVERVVFQEVRVKDFVAVLLVNVPAVAQPSIRVLDALPQRIGPVSIVNDLVLF